MSDTYFPLPKPPRIYAYTDTRFPQDIKVGQTIKTVQERVAEQYPVRLPSQTHTIVIDEPAIREDGSYFTDHDVHRRLRDKGIINTIGEWFKCGKEEVLIAIRELQSGRCNIENRSFDFKMRPEQQDAVNKTATYFRSFHQDGELSHPLHFLWNAKMRFGKTFTTYQLAKEMQWQRVLVLTFKPAVQSAWKEDLLHHIDFEGWQFLSNRPEDMNPKSKQFDEKKPFVYFGSFQDFLGTNSLGGIKSKNEWVHETDWDLVVLDEYHYGAWRESAKELFEAEDRAEQEFAIGEDMEVINTEIIPITTAHYLYLSGTPFRAMASGEFIEEQVFNWTYSDEQRAKSEWKGEGNPYAALPRMVMLTYQLPDSIRQIAEGGEFDEFDLNQFFKAEGRGEKATFVHEEQVQKWLDLIRGSLSETQVETLKLSTQRAPMPYSDVRLLRILQHTFWFLPSIASCYAMKNLIEQPQNAFYHDYQVIVAAGSSAGIGLQALEPVKKAMGDPLKTKTITLSCGKLTTGVTVKPWSGIFMLRNSSSPETYFQAAFRVQSPWTLQNPDHISPHEEVCIKETCYVFDFAPNRALKQVADYSCRLNIEESDPKEKVEDFIKFLPILAYDGSSMKAINAEGVLDIAMSGTTATLLARRWESALLVNVDNHTLQRLMSNPKAMEALMSIEGFRNLNQDIETIINKSEAIKKKKKEYDEETEDKTVKKELSKEEKEYKSMRKKIQEKLIKFATRVPIFMYLTDHRERSLKDVITELEPALFKKVTGLEVQDFELLVSLNLFNAALMNDAVYKFKRYEDSSLSYSGIDKSICATTDMQSTSQSTQKSIIGLFDTVISE